MRAKTVTLHCRLKREKSAARVGFSEMPDMYRSSDTVLLAESGKTTEA